MFISHGIWLFCVFTCGTWHLQHFHSLQCFGYISNLYKGTEEFHTESRDIIFFASAQSPCCLLLRVETWGFVDSPSIYQNTGSIAAKHFLLRNKPEGTLSSDASFCFIGLLLCIHLWRGECWEWNYTKLPASTISTSQRRSGLWVGFSASLRGSSSRSEQSIWSLIYRQYRSTCQAIT